MPPLRPKQMPDPQSARKLFWFLFSRKKELPPEVRKEELEKLIVHLLRLHPGAEVHGHRDFAAKACPGFDATAEYASLLAENSGHSVEPLK